MRTRPQVPPGALVGPTLMVTNRSAAAVYVQPAAELSRLTAAGSLVKVSRGIYVAVPVGERGEDWLPSLEALSAGIATAVHGYGSGALWGLSAARVHGALPRAIAAGYALGPAQHRPIPLLARPGKVEFRRRDPGRLDLELWRSGIGPAPVTSVDQTILDLSTRAFTDDAEPRAEAVRALLVMTSPDRVEDLALRVRGRSAWRRARELARRAG